MISQENSIAYLERAKDFIPGGVNSPVRAFKAVGGSPAFIQSAKGAYMIDEDGNKFIDLINSWGPMILGHANPSIEEAVKEAIGKSLSFGAPTLKEVEIAELICEMVPSVDKIRMVNSGTEATMSAIRVARGYTGKDKIIKFEGCYHGHGDSFLIAAGSGLATFGTPNRPGVTEGTAKDTLLAKFNDLEAVRELIKLNKNEIAAIILEPVAGNMGCIPPVEGYLEGLREICNEEGIVLIFDEVMTGFRITEGGAQAYYDVIPDMVTLGKIIGGGMPVGAYGGKHEIMNCVSPVGKVYQAGTLSGNPIAMAAGYAMLEQLHENPGVYNLLDENTTAIVKGIEANLKTLGLNYQLTQVGSMFCLFFTDKPVHNFDDAKKCDTALFGKYFHEMLKRGVYLPPSQFEANFVSAALSKEDIAHIIDANYEVLQLLHA